MSVPESFRLKLALELEEDMFESVCMFPNNSEQFFETKIEFFKQKPNFAVCKSLAAVLRRSHFHVISGK